MFRSLKYRDLSCMWFAHCVALTAFATIASSASLAAIQIDRVVMSGDRAPGSGINTFGSAFGGSIGQDGLVAFTATTNNSTSSGVYASRAGEGSVVLMSAGENIPGQQFQFIGAPAAAPFLPQPDRFVALASISGLGIPTNSYAAFGAEIGAPFELLVRFDQPFPGEGQNPTLIRAPQNLHVAPSGHMAFEMFMDRSPSPLRGLYTTQGGAVRVILLPGQQLPGGDGPRTVRSVFNRGALTQERIVFAPSFELGNFQFFSELWQDIQGVKQPILTRGQGLPGQLGVTVNSVSDTVTSRAGLTYDALLSGAGSSNDRVVGRYSFNSASHEVLVRTGNTTLLPGETITTLHKRTIGQSGIVAAEVTGRDLVAPSTMNHILIFSGQQPVVDVAATGRPAPGAGTRLFREFFSFGFNGSDDLVLFGRAGDVDGIWVAQFGRPLELLLLEGQPFAIAPGVVRNISNISGIFQNTDDGTVSDVRDSRAFIFNMTFDDGSRGIFTARIPEPAATAIAGALSMLSLCRRQIRS